jgi:dGTP triphosphohydrolase
VSVQLFRAYAIGAAVSAIIEAFSKKYHELMTGELELPLLIGSRAENICEMLKDFDKVHAYRNRGVLEIELRGFNVICGLMDLLWDGITLGWDNSEKELLERFVAKKYTVFAICVWENF